MHTLIVFNHPYEGSFCNATLSSVQVGNAIKKALFTGTFLKMGYRNRQWISLKMVKFVSEQKRKKWLTRLEEKFSALK